MSDKDKQGKTSKNINHVAAIIFACIFLLLMRFFADDGWPDVVSAFCLVYLMARKASE